MLLYYIDDSFFQPSAFARRMRMRLEACMDRDQPQLLIVSGRRNCDAPLRELSVRRNIAVLNAPGVFDYAGVRGILRCDSLLLEPVGSMHCFSGSFVRAETLRGRSERVYLEFFQDPQIDAFLRLCEQLENAISETLSVKDRFRH